MHLTIHGQMQTLPQIEDVIFHFKGGKGSNSALARRKWLKLYLDLSLFGGHSFFFRHNLGSFLREGRVVGPCWEKLKPKGPKGLHARFVL